MSKSCSFHSQSFVNIATWLVRTQRFWIMMVGAHRSSRRLNGRSAARALRFLLPLLRRFGLLSILLRQLMTVNENGEIIESTYLDCCSPLLRNVANNLRPKLKVTQSLNHWTFDVCSPSLLCHRVEQEWNLRKQTTISKYWISIL